MTKINNIAQNKLNYRLITLKKFIECSLLAIVLSLASTLPILNLINKATAAPSTPPDNCFSFDIGTSTITDYYDYEDNNNSNPACTREVIIPDTIGGNAVTSIGSHAFSYNQLTSVTIPNSVTSIGNSAFMFNQLANVTIEGNIVTSGNNVFFGNASIQAFTYGMNTFLYSDPITEDCFAFDGSSTITGFNKADIVTIRDNNSACLNPNVVIPSTIGGNSVVNIGDMALYDSQLTSVTIPNSVTSIGIQAFASNQLSSVNIGNSVESIGQGAFYSNSIAEVIIPDSVSYIAGFAFFDNQIAEVVIPDSVASMSLDAFTAQTRQGGTSYTDFYMSNMNSQVGQDFIDSVIYTNIYASPNQVTALNLTDLNMTEATMGGDINSDGDQDDILSGQLINPAQVTASYKDTNGNTIAPDATYAGTGLSSYLAISNTANDLNLYYKPGDSFTVPTAPTITGYSIQTTPNNIASLIVGDNPVDYIYTENGNGNGNDNGDNNGDNNSSNNIASLPNAVDGKNINITTPTTTNITCSNASKESTDHSDNDYQYTMGLVDFCFTTNQTNNTVSLSFETDLKPNQVTARKFNPSNNTYTNLPTNANVTITESTINNKHNLVLTYVVTDNGELDLDPTTGIIKDPVGLAVTNATYNQLTNTGNNNILPVFISMALITTALAAGITSKRKHYSTTK